MCLQPCSISPTQPGTRFLNCLHRSLELLYALGALDMTGNLTDPVGTQMARLPVDPMYGKVLLASHAMGCSLEAMQVVAIVSSDNVFISPR